MFILCPFFSPETTPQRERPDLVPDVILVDGNGVLHKRGFGLASHLGVLVDIPTVGVGKNWCAWESLREWYMTYWRYVLEIHVGDASWRYLLEVCIRCVRGTTVDWG